MASGSSIPSADSPPDPNVIVVRASPKRKIVNRRVLNRIPDDIVNHPALARTHDLLPKNYDFEFPKTVWRIKQLKAKRVAIQLPEGLQMFAITISDVLEEMTGVDVIILGDVTYGACCVDDFTARTLKADLLVHYGHSCLVPVDLASGINFLYIFVNIRIDITHVEETVVFNFPPSQKLALVSTVQFVAALQEISLRLQKKGYTCWIPQSKPLSPGELLGCTAPRIPEDHFVICLGDGRFHLEASMIANPKSRHFRYDPYEKKLTEEHYDHTRLRESRTMAILKARQASRVGFILGTLGRQGSPQVLNTLMKYFDDYKTDPSKLVYKKNYVIVLISEITPEKLKMFGDSVDAWVQVACPRLSIDWGTAFDKPLLTPYEAHIAFSDEHADVIRSDPYPMDYYAENSLGPWTPRHNPMKSVAKCCESKPKCSETESSKCGNVRRCKEGSSNSGPAIYCEMDSPKCCTTKYCNPES